MSVQAGIRRLVAMGARKNPAWPAIYSELAGYGLDLRPVDQDMERLLSTDGVFPTIAACVNKLIALAAVVPLYQADRDTGDALEEPRLRNWRGEDLLEQPNPGEGKIFFRMKSYQQLALTGNLYHAVGNSMAEPRELWVCESSAMKPVLSASNQYPFAAFVYDGPRRKERIPAERVIFTRRPHSRDKIFGRGFPRECWDALEFLYLSRRYNKLLLQRGGRSGGFLFVKGGLGDAERKLLEAKLEERQAARNAGKVVVLGADDAAFTSDTSPPRDMEHPTTTLEAKLEIYNVFGFMPALFATRDVNRSNLREAKASAYEDAVMPFVELMLEQWNSSDMCLAAGVSIRADWMSVQALQANLLEKAQASALLLDRQVMVPNEAAELFGLNSKEWGDEPSRPPVSWVGGLPPPGAEIDEQLKKKAELQKDIEAAKKEPVPPPVDEEEVARAARLGPPGPATALGRVGSGRTPRRGQKTPPRVQEALQPRPPDRDRDAGDSAFEARVNVALARLDRDGCGPLPGTRAFERLETRGTARDKAWVRLERRRMTRENAWVRRLRDLFDQVEDEVLGNIRAAARNLPPGRGDNGRRDTSSEVPEDWIRKRWYELSRAIERWTFELVGVGTTDLRTSMESTAETLTAAGIPDVAIDVDAPQVQEWLRKHLGKKVLGLQETSVTRLQDIVAAVVREGLSVGELEQRIQEEFRFARRVRSRVIARTESTGLFTQGNIFAMQQNGVTQHSWLATRDTRTRPAHRAIDGQVRAVGEDFEMTDPDTGQTASGPGPGQMSAAWASAQCRCTTLPEVF